MRSIFVRVDFLASFEVVNEDDKSVRELLCKLILHKVRNASCCVNLGALPDLHASFVWLPLEVSHMVDSNNILANLALLSLDD